MPLVTRIPRNPPPTYPHHFEQVIETPSGTELWMRPIVPADAAALADEFARADDDTVYMRFFSPSFDLSEDRLRYLTEIDYSSHLAFVVMTNDAREPDGVAIARYAARTDTDVEAAIVVKPEFRKRGIARLLLEHLADAAATAGYETMSASFLAENDAAARLLESCGFGPAEIVDGVAATKRELIADSAEARSV